MASITVFTPTYNRAELLRKGYEALKRQTSFDFEWLIIDDGSFDDTETVVNEWIKENTLFSIRYYYKENGGLHTAYNYAIEKLDTELAMCVDSDDYLADDAIESILTLWRENGSDKYAGIVGLDFTEQGQVIGDYLPNCKSISLVDMALGKYNIRHGDRKLILRSELYKKFAPMKVFPGEKYFNPNYLHMEVAKLHEYLVLNKKICIVEYQPGGMSSNIWKQYYNSPRSFAELRKQHLSFPNSSAVYQYKEYVHYSSCCFLAGEKLELKINDYFLYAAAVPLGFMLSLYIRYKNWKK